MPFRGRALLPMVIGPTVWAFYFLVAYAGAAIVCERWPASLDTARWILLAIGILAASGVALTSTVAGISWRQDLARIDHGGTGDDSTAARRAFLAFATLLLGGLSVIAILYTAAPLLLSGTCR